MMENNSSAFKTVIKIIWGLAFFLGLPVLLFLLAGTWNWWQAWLYIGISFTATLTSRIFVNKLHPDLIKERASFDNKKDTKPWDRILMPAVAIIMPTLYFLTAGLDKRYGWSGGIPFWFYIIALIITLGGYAFSTWAILENRFFSAVVRIQTDRNQSVIDSGPYRIVRHPGYAAGLMVALMFPLMLGSWWAYIPVGMMIFLTILRTALEDQALIKELPGYAEYIQKTKFRLLPGIW
jgi:protein-S-isoprenylcysteine O-methyltransferase Ste14